MNLGPRDSHISNLVEDMMIVFGGSNGTKKVNGIHMLDLRTTEWPHPNTATLVGDRKLFIFGGSGEGGANYLNDLHV